MIAPPYQPAAAARLGFWDAFKASPWWQKVLVLIPLVLVLFGGLIGGLIGALAGFANMSIFRSRLGTGAKAAIAIGIDIGAGVVVIVIATIIYVATHPNG